MRYLCVAILAVATSARGITAQTTPQCPPPGTSATTVSAAGLAGRYRLVFVATQGDRRGRTVRGTLTLLPRDSVTAVLRTFDGQPHPNLSEPYVGAARIELDSVGAYTEGRIDSDDPARPGVVVREVHWPRRNAPAEEELSLGLGAERNRRDVTILDGAFVHAVIRERTAGGFRGMAACHAHVPAPNRSASVGPDARAANGPVTIAQYTCVLSLRSVEIRCSAPPARLTDVSPSEPTSPSSPYAQLYIHGLVRDTFSQTWTFSAAVKNLLSQPIGALDGKTMLGTRVAITEAPTATGGTGTITVANATGAGTFTGPDQRYFFYNEITAPQAFTAEKQWRFNVPNTVTEISIGIVISTDFPAEQDVAPVPPDSQPAWAHADTAYKDEWLKRVVAVVFERGASTADRQLAVASVGGTVVGGSSLAGMYLLAVPDNGGFVQVDTAVARLNRLPQVGAASRMGRVRGLHLKAHHGSGWRS